MEIKQNIAPYTEEVKQIYTQVVNKTKEELEYTLLQNWNLSKSFGCFEDNHLIGFVAVSEKTLMNETNIYKVVLLEGAYFDRQDSPDLQLNLLQHAFDHLRPYYDSVFLSHPHWDSVPQQLELEDALVVHQCEFIPGEYPTPMLMTWEQPEPNIMAGVETLDGEDRLGLERPLQQISLDIRCKQNKNLAFLANPFAYVWYHPTTKVIDTLTYNETAQLTWLLNQIQPQGLFYLYANTDLNGIPALKIVHKDIVLVKVFKASKTVLKNVKFLDLA